MPFLRLLRLAVTLTLIGVGALAPLPAQRQMEALGRGVIAMRTSSTQVYVGWRLLGDDPSDLTFNIYRSVGGAPATKINNNPIGAATNLLDTPGSTALASAIAYHVVPVRGGVEQTPSAPYVLPAGTAVGQQFFRLPLSTPRPNPASTAPYDVKFCWVGDFDGDGEYDFLVDRVPTSGEDRQYLEAYKRDGTFLWRMDMGPNSTNHYVYEPGSSAISVGDTDNVTVYDLDGDGRAEVVVRTANGVTVTNAAGQLVASISAANNTAQFVSVFNGLTGAELARTPLPNPWAQYGTLTNKCAIGYFDGQRPSVLFYGYNRDGNGPFYRVFSAFDFRDGQLTLRWTLPQTFPGAEGHQIRIADVDNDGRDEIIDIGHVIDDDGTQLFVIPEISHGDRFHVADINPDRPGLENYVIQQYNSTFLATAYFDAGTGEMLRKWYAPDLVDVGRGIAQDLTAAHKGYEMYSTQPGIFNAKGDQIYVNSVWAPEGLWWDTDLLREFIDGAGSGALNPVINKFNASTGNTDRVWTLYNDFGNFSTRQAFGGRPAFWGDILGDWREELVLVTSDYTALRIYTTTNVASNRLYTLMHNPAYRMQATTKGYVQSSNVDYYLGVGMTTPPPPPMVSAQLAWSGAPFSTWDNANTFAWQNTSTSAASVFTSGQSVRFDLAGTHLAPVTLSGALQPGEVTVYSPNDYIFDGSAGSLTGPMPLVKAGRGTLRITGSHPFTGATTVWDGALRVDGALTDSAVTVWGGTWGGALAKGLTGGRLSGSGNISRFVSLQYRGALTPGPGMSAAGTLTLGAGLSASDGSVLAFDLSADPSGVNQPSDRLAITGPLTLSGKVTLLINALAGSLAPGTYTLATYTGTLTGSAANLDVVVPEGTPYTLGLGSGALTLTVPLTRPADVVTWSGAASGAWDLAASANWTLAGAPDVFVSGDTVAFDDTGSSRPSVTLDASAPVSALTFSGATAYTFSGSGAIAGPGGLTKSGPATVTLNLTNTYTGPTVVSGGVLSVNNLADGGSPSSLGASSSAATNLVLNGGTLRLVGPQTSTNRAITLAAGGGTIDLPPGNLTLQISGGLTGPGALTKTGAGSLILATANTHSGGTLIQAGTLVLASDTANVSGLGSGGVTFTGGTLRMYYNDDISSAATSSWPIHVPAGATGRLEADGRATLSGPLTGAGTFEFFTPFIRTDMTGNWSAFTGRLNIVADGDGGDFRVRNTAGYGNAHVSLGANVTFTYITTMSGNLVLDLGSLSGNALSSVRGGPTSGRTLTWRVGARGDDTVFAGRFFNGTGPTALTKIGSGTLTLSGASEHTGATTVTGGRLLLASGSLTGSAVTVQLGAGFGGRGFVTGNVSFNAGSTLLASPASGPLAITGNLTLGSAITVAPAPGLALTAGSYSLLTYSGTLTGTPNFQWAAGTGYAATFNTSTAGQVTYTLTKTSQPPSGVVALPGDTEARLSWSAPAGAVSAYDVLRAASPAGPFTAVVTGLTTLAHTDPGLTNGRTYHYVLRARYADGSEADSAPVSVSVGPATPHALWRFDEPSGSTSLSDTPAWNGTLVASPTRITGRINRAVSLSAASAQHVTVPAGALATLQDFTFATWVNLTSVTNWSRIVDFGTGTNNYLFLSPRSSTNGTVRFAIRTPATTEQAIDGPAPLTAGVWTHVAVTLSGSNATLYVNGVAVAANSAMTLTPASLGSTTQNYLGRSQFTSDPHLNGSLDETAFFARALTPTEVSRLASPPPAPASLTATPGPSQIALNWTSVGDAESYTVRRAVGGTSYALIAENIATTGYTDTTAPLGQPAAYVVTARRSVAESGWSPVATATPTPPHTAHQSWRLQYFGTADPTGQAADTADPDADGLANLLEYAFGLHPLVPSSPSAHPALPAPGIDADRIRLTFTPSVVAGLSYHIQSSSDLLNWFSTEITSQLTVDQPFTHTDSADLDEHPRRFLRLQITAP